MMKTMKKIALVAIGVVLAWPAVAQKNVIDAFDRLKSQPQITASRLSTQQNEDGVIGKLEEYKFSYDKKEQLISPLIQAFQDDADEAYSYIVHDGDNDKKEPYWVYQDDNNRITVGSAQRDNYVLYCIADDDNRDYRYCYAVEWREKNGTVTGRVLKAYSPRPKANEKRHTYSYFKDHDLDDVLEQARIRTDGVLASLDSLGLDQVSPNVYIGGTRILSSQPEDEEDFLEKFDFIRNRFKRVATKDNSSLPVNYATKMLKLCRQAQKLQLSDNMHKLCIKGIKEMRDMSSDDFVKGILDEAIIQLR